MSRVGGAAQTPLIKKLAGSSKLELAQYYELAAFAQFASELDDYAQKQLRRGESVVEILKQTSERRYAVWEGAVLLFAVSQGYFDGLDKHLIVTAKDVLLTYVQRTLPEFIETISRTPKLTDDIKDTLSSILEKQPAQAYVST